MTIWSKAAWSALFAASLFVSGCDEGDSGREDVAQADDDDVSEAGDGVWRGEGAGWDGNNRPDGDGYSLHYIQGGWVVKADLRKVSLLVSDPLNHCASPTSEWVSHEEQAARGVFAAINTNFFECDVGNTFRGRSCPTEGDPVPADGALAAEQYPIGAHCGERNCFDNTGSSSAKYMSHLVVDTAGRAQIKVYDGGGTPDGPPFNVPSGHTAPGEVSNANVAYVVSGAPTLIRNGVINDTDAGWSSLHYYPGLADRGSIPFFALSYDKQTAYLGMVQGGGRLAANELLKNFDDIEHAIGFDAGASPTFWFKGYAPVRASRLVPAKLAFASPKNARAGTGRSACLDSGGSSTPPSSPPNPPGGGNMPE